MLDKAHSKKWTPSEALETAYRCAQQEWDSRMGSTLQQARNWRLFAFICLGLAIMLAVGNVYLGTLPKKVTEYVTIDGAGNATYIGEAGNDWESFSPTEAQVAKNIRRFVDDTRSLSSDPMIIRKNWVDAYTLVAGEATQILSQYAQNNDPFQRAKESRINVEIETALAVSNDTWQVDWFEETWSKSGTLTDTTAWRGTFTVERLEPDSEKAIKTNPISVYITRFSWQKVTR
ncbi:MAG: conjugal transfer protein TrbF [Pseudomonadales bacterium]